MADEMTRWPSNWRVVLFFLGVGALFVAVGLAWTWELSTPAMEVEPGAVVRFSGNPYAVGTRGLTIVVRLKNGRILELQNGSADVRHCRVGSSIRLNRKGSYVRIHPEGCPPPA